MALAAATVAWQHLALFGAQGSLWSHAPYLLVDLLLTLPVAAIAVGLVAAVWRRIRLRSGSDTYFGALGTWEPAARAAAITIVMTVLYVPLAVAQAIAHTALAPPDGHHHGATGLPATDLSGLLGYGLTQALQIEAAILVVALAGVVVQTAAARGLLRSWLLPKVKPANRFTWALTLVVGTLAGTLTAGTAQATPVSESEILGGTGGCQSAPQRVFNVSAIDIDIVVNRTGDHDPYGYMYVLNSGEAAVRAQEAALKAASNLPIDDPTAAKVSNGLGQDPIQPLVLRARLGECVVINLTNKIVNAPRGGPNGSPVITQPGGVPPVSIDLAGVSYDAAGGQGGQAVGANPVNLAAPGGPAKTYRYFLDPLMGEGAKVFRSGGDSVQLTAHGLFGTLVAEDSGARWYDPVSGAEKTNDNNWNNWEAMVDPASGPTFREPVIMYHEIGDENFNLRRPLRENADAAPAGDQVQNGRPLPMIDAGAPVPANPRAGGGGTNAYRPGSRALNYRSEPFFRRLQNEAPRGLAAQQNNESIAYSSYPYGDPATPIVRSYLGEPTKTRLVHAGFEQLHVHHLHGGATRWRQNPGADNTAMDSGLTKVPIQNAKSIRLDSQTISPMEAMTLEHECGAGGCQQAAGDFLYHCHIAHHYIAGMWGMWRVFDTAQATLAKLPSRAAAPTAVNSAGLLGRVIEGKTVVLQANLTSPSTQVALESLVEGQLPPQGARFTLPTGADPDDATVWDWLKGGTATAPVYLGEPETTAVWDNYRSPTPGVRPEILFNPVNGRPAYPMLKPHLGMRPPFSPNGHSGAPYLGDTATATRPDGLCPSAAPARSYDITAISVGVQATHRENDPSGEIFVLNEDKNAVLGGTKPVEPLTIRSNVGDCVSITFGQQLDPAVQGKTNMHTHFVQFDPRASDGVITGFAYEQSVFSMNKEARTLSSVDAPNTITVSSIGQLRVGVSVGIGVGTPNIEVRKIIAIAGNQLTLDSNLAKSHAGGDPVTVEFVQYRWYSDVDAGTVFWHDHVDGIESWAHGLFGAHIIEPAGSTYRDPVTGAAAKSGTMVDIITGGSVGVGQSGSFREFMVFLHNGRRGRNELTAASGGGLTPFNSGQECEEGSINLRAEPIGERTPPGATPADPSTTMQRQEYSGQRCRNAFSRGPDVPTNAAATTTRATVSTVDPYVFSSVKYGDPMTPLLRAYAGDPVVVRTIGLVERAEALRIQGHRFRMERFNADGQLMDAATTGISERFDYVLDGGAGGPARSPGDYLYYSTRTFALESGAWGIFRVYDKLQSSLKPLPNKTPPSGVGFPKQVAATGNTQATPGPNPAPGWNANGSPNTAVVSSLASPCPGGVPFRNYDVSIFNMALPTAPFSDTSGVIYSLTADMAGIVAGTKPIEPLVIRANKGECVDITFRNQLTAGSLYGGTRAGMDLAKLSKNQELASGAAVGLNPDTTVAIGGSIVYRYYADQELGTTIFQNLGSVGSLRHGAYGMLIVEPQGSIYQDSFTGATLNSTKTAQQAVIRPPGFGNDFREFAMQVQTTDQQYSRSIIPYIDQVAGIGINSVTAANIPVAPVEGAPPGTANNAGSLDKAYSSVNYRSEPLTARLGLTANPANYTAATVNGNYGIGFCSTPYGDPDTPVYLTYGGDPVVWRVAVGASDQLHSFTIGGHNFPLEPKMWNGTTDKRSQLMTARTIGAGETIDAELTSAGGSGDFTGDYLYQDARSPFAEAGIWGIFRVLPLPFGAAAQTSVPIEIAES